ncbi:LADA_0G13234g1_1 [Lachancea dasiensis]|uniref:LADA_0G13234g1_1 n=1 Tax=Lachancea dasiensis TaxID=1072105 RepID=A0A1G4JVJ3_9SACH|nr:LADA_0G13234g1_1 [Lachancea dasiensis]
MTTIKRELDTPLVIDEASKRRGSKPGRKPLDSEAKNKRTAQNRAAQRAFRERKEKKMRELEDKVQQLEKVQEQNEMESGFLRTQLQQLIAEVQKYRPEQASDSQVLQYLAKSEQLQRSLQQRSRGRRSGSDSASRSRSRSRSGSRNPSTGTPSDPSEDASPTDIKDDALKIRENMQRKMNFTFEYPKNTPSSGSYNGTYRSPVGSVSTNGSNTSFGNKNLNFSGNTPSTSSGSLDLFSYNSDSQSLPKFTPSNYSGSLSNDFDFNSHFDEQVSEFCTQMNQVCGTRDCPIPKKTSVSSASNPSQASPLVQPRSNHSQSSHTALTNSPSVSSPSDLMNNLAKPAPAGHVPQEAPLTNSWDSPQFGHSGFGPELEDPTTKWLFAGTNTPGNATTVRASTNEADALPFIDASLAFPNDQEDQMFNNNSDDVLNQFFEDDPTVSQLTNEESNYDLFRQNSVPTPGAETQGSLSSADSRTSASRSSTSTAITDFGENAIGKSLKPSPSSVGEQSYENSAYDVVPARDGNLLKCTEIWDRITAHPKYSDLDIDGLCVELRTKAKCSEKGVVVNSDDVQRALGKHMS